MSLQTPPVISSVPQNQRFRLPEIRRRPDFDYENEAARPLTSDEINSLKANGNTAADWDAVKVFGDFRPDLIIANRFEGNVLLGGSGPAAEGELPPGVYHSCIANSVIGPGARVAYCNKVSRTIIGRNAVLESVACIQATGESTVYGNDLVLFEGTLYSRRLRAFAELPFDSAAELTGPGPSDTSDADSDAHADAYAESLRGTHTYVAQGAQIRSVPLIENCWIGSHVRIEATGSLRDSTIWGEAEAPTLITDGASLKQALIGSGSVVEQGALIERSILFEQVSVSRQAIIAGCAVGANSTLAEGELNNSLLGPFTTALHHSLTISAWWPEGKGNISAGANVGSNHTGRVPDQEIWPGEGVFFGLGCNIKYPASYRDAPFTLLATGVSALPQKVEFPFSLILDPINYPDDLPSGLNEIRPGWAIWANSYGVERHQQKYSSRNKARHTRVEVDVLRPEMANRMAKAVVRLQVKNKNSIYTEKDVPGLGKNFMTESARLEALQAFNLGQAMCLVRSIFVKLDQLLRIGKIVTPLGSQDLEFLREFEPGGLEERLELSPGETIVYLQERWCERVCQSKDRDRIRGERIISDYSDRHTGVEADPVVLQARQDLELLKTHRAELEMILGSK